METDYKKACGAYAVIFDAKKKKSGWCHRAAATGCRVGKSAAGSLNLPA